MIRDTERSFTGIYLQETGEFQNMDIPMYTRIGDCGIMDGGGYGFMLDGPSWARLLKATSAEELGKKLVIV